MWLDQCYCFYFVIRMNETTSMWYFHWFFCTLFIRSNSTSSFFMFSFTFSKFCPVIVTFQAVQLQHFNIFFSSLKLKLWIMMRITFAKFCRIICEHREVLTAYMMLQICTFPGNKSGSVLHCILKLRSYLPSHTNVCYSVHYEGMLISP
jgi:hypothetical protein